MKLCYCGHFYPTECSARVDYWMALWADKPSRAIR